MRVAAAAIATHRIEELMGELKQQYTISIVSHNMQQASRDHALRGGTSPAGSAEEDRSYEQAPPEQPRLPAS